MKTIICFLISFLFLFEMVSAQTSGSKGWFWQYPKPQGNTLRDIYVFSSDTAIAVGDLSTIIKTTDGGNTWNVQSNISPSQVLYSVQFIDALNGWAAGGNYLLKTSDGGKSWMSVDRDTSFGIFAAYFVDSDTGFVFGATGYISRTTDGGNTWKTKIIDDYIGIYLDVFYFTAATFTDKNTGWLVGTGFYGNEIYKTTDCGRTWVWNGQTLNPVYYNFTDIYFVDKNYGFITGTGVLKTTDGGTTWQNIDPIPHQWPYPSIIFTDSLTGWITGGETGNSILKTVDGGNNWTTIVDSTITLSDTFYKVRFADKNNGWIVGRAGIIYRTTNTGNNWISQRDDIHNFKSIYFVNENTGWAVGDSGVILSTTDGGDNWRKQNQNDSLLLSSVYAIDGQNVVAVGSVIKGLSIFDRNGIILRTNNGGLSWLRQTFDSLNGFNCIVFINDSTGWISGTEILMKTVNKGNSWQQTISKTSDTYNTVQFINNNTGWISTYLGNSLLNTTNGGASWNAQLIDTNFSLYSFHFLNANSGWAVGAYNEGKNIFKTIDGGKNWLPCTNTPISDYTSVYFVNETIGWAGGFDYLNRISSLIKTTDGGNIWNSQECLTTDALSSVFMLNENTGWVVGNGIFKTTNGGGVVSVKDGKEFRNNIPEQIKLFQNYPNPFNPTTTIEYQIPPSPFYKKGERGGFVSLKVYDLLGREVVTLVDDRKPAGKYTVQWNAENLSSGIYFYRLRSGGFSETKKMILIR